MAETIIEDDKDNMFPLLNTKQLRALYGAVIRKYAENDNFFTFDIDHEAYGLAKKMRQEITRRIGDGWLTVYHQARRTDAYGSRLPF